MARKMKTFKCEAMSHDIFSTKFCRDGKVDTLSRTDYKEPPIVTYESKMMILNDQGGSVMDITDDITATLRAQDHGHPPVVCHPVYCIEGNVVDRVSSKNGKGWCEDVSPTLNTQDRHAVVVALEGNGARPSHMGKGFSKDGAMYTLNTIEQHSVCYSVENKHEVSHD